MKEIIVNNTSNDLFDTKIIKARAIIINEFDNIYVCNMNNSFFLPGGTVEDGESPLETIKRELDEEVGLVIDTITPLITIKYYHDNFPTKGLNDTHKRLNEVHYYILKINRCDIGSNHFTTYEKDNNMVIEEIAIKDLYNKLNVPSSNRYKKFTDKELETILKIYDENKV